MIMMMIIDDDHDNDYVDGHNDDDDGDDHDDSHDDNLNDDHDQGAASLVLKLQVKLKSSFSQVES